jgi:hypothetical protein
MQYEGTWYNYVAQEDQIIKIEANNIKEAYVIATLVMKYYAGNHYKPDDIVLHEQCSSPYTMQEIEEKYLKNKDNDFTSISENVEKEVEHYLEKIEKD